MNDIDPVLRAPETGKAWVVGLRWTEPVSRGGVAPRNNRDMPVSVIARQGRGARHARRHGSGRLPVRYRRETLYSLAMACCRHYRNGYGIWRIDEYRWVFLASQQGLPAVVGDVSGSLEEAVAARDLFLSLNDMPEEGWDCQVSPDDAQEWWSLTEGLTAAALSRLRVRPPGQATRRLLPAVLLPVLVAFAVYGFTHHSPPDVLSPDEVAERARMLAQEAPPPPPRPHPWADLPPARGMIQACENAWKAVPVSAGGWLLKEGRCDTDGLTLHWTWLQGGTAQSLTRALARHWPDTPPVIDLMSGARDATLRLPVTFTPGRDETVPDQDTQLARAASAWQRQGLTVPFADITPDPVPDEDGVLPPPLPWKTFTFTLTGPARPSTVTARNDDTGLRIRSVSFTLNGATVSYTTEGLLYASR